MKLASPAQEHLLFEGYKEFDNHESVTFIHDTDSGLKGFIAIHNTNLGPAVGGTRFWYYENEEEALKDALRLSRAMTYKCSLAGVPYGGGKAVLMAPAPNSKMPKEYAIAYAKRLISFDCPFFTGEDVGLTEEDVRLLAKQAPTCIIGKPEVGGLPSEWAALSVFYSMKAAMRERFGSESFKGKTVAVKGLGNVGYGLCLLLAQEGAKITGADIKKDMVERAQANVPGITIESTDKIGSLAVDVYAPCALGNEFKASIVPTLSCSIICGAANNQLTSREVGRMLDKRGILYVPDYVANAGGLINVVDELNPAGYSRERVIQNIERIHDTVRNIIQEATTSKRPISDVADEIAERRYTASRV